jgi:hypothetical protein
MGTSSPKTLYTSKLLLHEEPLQVLPALAVALGLNEAIILQQLHYWLRKKSHPRDGLEWHYNTYVDWQKQFPFWSISTIKRAMTTLEKQGVVIAANYNSKPIDKTKWYAIDYKKLNDLCGDSTAQNEPSTCQNEPSTAQNEPSTCQNEPSTCQNEPSTAQNDTLDGSFCYDQSPETTSETTDRDLNPPPLPPLPSRVGAEVGLTEVGLTEVGQSATPLARRRAGLDVESAQRCDDAFREKPAATVYTPGFLRAWHAWPMGRKQGKAVMWRIWCERGLEPRAAEIVEKIDRLHWAIWSQREPRYTPTPRTWFEEARYEDDLVPLEVAQTPDRAPRLSYVEAQRAREAEAQQRFLGAHDGRSRRQRDVLERDDTVIDGVEYRIDG